jgi:serine/threonine protein kinase
MDLFANFDATFPVSKQHKVTAPIPPIEDVSCNSQEQLPPLPKRERPMRPAKLDMTIIPPPAIMSAMAKDCGNTSGYLEEVPKSAPAIVGGPSLPFQDGPIVFTSEGGHAVPHFIRMPEYGQSGGQANQKSLPPMLPSQSSSTLPPKQQPHISFPVVGAPSHSQSSSVALPPSPVRFAPSTSHHHTIKPPAVQQPKDQFATGPRIGPFVVGRTLGVGSTGKVKLGVHIDTGERVAIKIIPKQSNGTELDVDSNLNAVRVATECAEAINPKLEREITLLKLLPHRNVLQLLDVYESPKTLYLILELVEGGELFEYLVKRGRLAEEEAVGYFWQIVCGVEWCHRHLVCHRDLKPENLLLSHVPGTAAPKKTNLSPHQQQIMRMIPTIKIADFGMSRLQPMRSSCQTSCGSPHYAAPEVIRGETYDGKASDIWSLGVILFALITGNLPFDDDNVRKLLSKVKEGKVMVPAWVGSDAKDLMLKMMTVKVGDRIAMHDILRHPLFAKYPHVTYDLAQALKEPAEDANVVPRVRMWLEPRHPCLQASPLLSPALVDSLARILPGNGFSDWDLDEEAVNQMHLLGFGDVPFVTHGETCTTRGTPTVKKMRFQAWQARTRVVNILLGRPLEPGLLDAKPATKPGVAAWFFGTSGQPTDEERLQEFTETRIIQTLFYGLLLKRRAEMVSRHEGSAKWDYSNKTPDLQIRRRTGSMPDIFRDESKAVHLKSRFESPVFCQDQHSSAKKCAHVLSNLGVRVTTYPSHVLRCRYEGTAKDGAWVSIKFTCEVGEQVAVFLHAEGPIKVFADIMGQFASGVVQPSPI